MDIFKTGENLAVQFPESKLIHYKELDWSAKRIVELIRNQIWFSVAGLTGYPIAGKLTGQITKPGVAIGVCMSVHVLITKYCQGLLLKGFMEGHLTKSITFGEAQKKYSHLIVDLKGNILLVKEQRKGAVKRFLSNFYLAKVRLNDPLLEPSKAFRLMRKAQRKIWPGSAQLKRWKTTIRPKTK